MIINLTKSKLFNIAPDERFSEKYELPEGIWVELWRRHKLMGYTFNEMAEYFRIKTGKTLTYHCVRRWVRRTEIYSIASPFLKLGSECVQSAVFGKYEKYVIDEITKHMRYGEHQDSKSII